MCVHSRHFSAVHSDWIQESPTLDLVNDFSHFVVGFFEVISTSAPHIYHSALPQSPQTSTVRKLYEPYAHPFTRVVQGVPISWEPVVATFRHRGYIFMAAWSPCSRYIVVSQRDPTMIEILDAATLERLHTFKPRDPFGWLGFSADSRLLTQFSNDHQEVTTWDLQTGGQISTIPPTSHTSSNCFSSTYSIDGKIAAVACLDRSDGSADTTCISTYNLLSRTHTYSHHVSEGRVVAPIWTHGECLRFVTVKPGTITVWQIGFASIHTLTKVESFPAPENIDYSVDALFLPTRSRLALPDLGILDVRDSKLLLEIRNSGSRPGMSFSSDGRFFAYGSFDAEIHIWEESPTGYVPRRQLGSGIGLHRTPLLSPNGKSIITSIYNETQLWRTTDPITSPSSIPTRSLLPTNFLLDISPDGSLAATARSEDKMATVLDLQSGNPQLIIDTGMEIRGLWVTGNTITVFDGRRIIAWELSAGDHVLNARVTIRDSVWSITLDHPTPPSKPPYVAAISRDLNYIVILSQIEDSLTSGHRLGIYDMPTGNHLVGAIAQLAHTLWITPDGCEVGFSTSGGHVGGWKIVKDGKSNVIGLEPLPENLRPPGGYPRRSSHGYDITDDGWILNSRKKQLMWLPHHWREVYEEDHMWDRRFLGLLNWELPELIIVELGE